ncbi:E3 ubiquitin-protein ligase arih1-like [Oscarella lobularis]|uniref:E3 ubiquitin-protein ligase arih1-like n=1 Tax=Oscarella lobularis TaxID=121494 RepID=UPI003313AA74
MDSDDGYDDEAVDLCTDDDEDELDLVESTPMASQQSHEKADDFDFDCLTPETIAKTMIESIEEVNNIFQIPATAARQLLVFFNWDKERLLERYFSGDQDKLFAQAHIVNPHKKRHIPTLPSTATCQICFGGVEPKDFTGVECGHQFCRDCWEMYLTVKISDEGMCQDISCPAHECRILVDEVTVYQLLKDPVVIKKYQYLLAGCYIEANRLMKFCPGPGCQNAVRVTYNESRQVRCLCNHSFCFGCLDLAHEPVKCHYLKKWKKKCDNESETSNWLSANTKECPKCHAAIEKGGGCNHMVCRNRSCKFEFCWVCQGPWQPHGSSWYNCNRYDEKDAKAARNSQATSRASLDRYLFYYNRYANHLRSAKLEKKLNDSIKKKMDELQRRGMTWIEVQFLTKAVDVLCMSRETLMYTYVFAFYLKKNNQSVIFEENQKDVEMATETLSGYLERDMLTADVVAELKRKVQDQLRYCQQRRSVLLAHVYEGYDKELWDYIEA